MQINISISRHSESNPIPSVQLNQQSAPLRTIADPITTTSLQASSFLTHQPNADVFIKRCYHHRLHEAAENNRVAIASALIQKKENASSCKTINSTMLRGDSASSIQGVRKPAVDEFTRFKDVCEKFVCALQSKQNEIAACLSQYESFDVVQDELTRTAECLRSLDEIKSYLHDTKVKDVSVFFPLNLPIYSMALFGIVPSFVAKDVYIRPPQKMMPIFQKLLPLLSMDQFFPNIHSCFDSREDFVSKYTSNSDVTIFTGREENALKVLKQCKKDSLFLFNGWGCNPVVISPDANLEKAVEKTVEVKLFNSGQDCAGPDTILVHRNIAKPFLAMLTAKLENVKVGDYSDHEVKVGKIVEHEQLSKVSSILLSNHKNIVHGGSIDYRRAIVEPTVIVAPLNEKKNYEEFFSPVFFVNTYDSDTELEEYFGAPQYKRNEMYSSLFGSSNYVTNNLHKTIVIKEGTILDIEHGNSAYGGHSVGASFVASNGRKEARPILVPREIALFEQAKAKQANVLTKKIKSLITQKFQLEAPAIFGDNFVSGFIFGSVAKGFATKDSDIDTMVILKQRDTPQEIKFLRFMRNLHKETGLVCDKDYPSEIVSVSQLDEAIEHMPNVALSLQNNSSAVYDRVVWGEVLSGNKTAIVGDRDVLLDYTKRCAKFPSLWKEQVIRVMEESELSPKVQNAFPEHTKKHAIQEVEKLELSWILRKFVHFEEALCPNHYSEII